MVGLDLVSAVALAILGFLHFIYFKVLVTQPERNLNLFNCRNALFSPPKLSFELKKILCFCASLTET